MSVGVSAAENQDTEETNVVETQGRGGNSYWGWSCLERRFGVSANENDKLPQVDKDVLEVEEAAEKAIDFETTKAVAQTEENSDDLPIVEWNDDI